MLDKKNRVLFIAKNIPVQGRKSNRIIFDIARNLSSFCDIQFLFPKEIVPFWLKNNRRFAYLYNLKSWIFEGYKIIPITYIKLPFKHLQYWTLFKLPKTVKKYLKDNNRFDLVHAHYLFPDGFIAYKINKKYKIPYVLTFRNQDKQYLEIISTKNPDYKKAKKVFINAKAVLTPNLGYKKFIDEMFDVKCRIVPHGIESTVFNSSPLLKQEDSTIITTVGDTVPTKNIDWVIKAVMAYKGIQKIKLNIIGDVALVKSLKNIANDDERITFLGRIPREKVLEQMRKSDIFALPSSKETFGLVYLEAAATNNAIIGFKGEGVWGVFEQNEEILFCSNYDEFKFQLFELIKNDKARTKLQQNVFIKAKTMQWEEIIRIYEGIYNSAITKKSNG